MRTPRDKGTHWRWWAADLDQNWPWSLMPEQGTIGVAAGEEPWVWYCLTTCSILDPCPRQPTPQTAIGTYELFHGSLTHSLGNAPTRDYCTILRRRYPHGIGSDITRQRRSSDR